MKKHLIASIIATLYTINANAVSEQSISNKLIDSNLKICFSRLSALKEIDNSKYIYLNKRITGLIQSQSLLNINKNLLSKETIEYVESQQYQAIDNTCSQIKQALDSVMLKKLITPMY